MLSDYGVEASSRIKHDSSSFSVVLSRRVALICFGWGGWGLGTVSASLVVARTTEREAAPPFFLAKRKFTFVSKKEDEFSISGVLVFFGREHSPDRPLASSRV